MRKTTLLDLIIEIYNRCRDQHIIETLTAFINLKFDRRTIKLG